MNLTLYSKHFGIYGFRGSKEHRLGILSTPYQLRDYGQVNLSDSIYCSVGMSQRMLPWSLSSKESACNAGDTGSIPGSGRSPGEGNSNPLQDSCLGNPMDRGAWWATVHGVAESDMT